VMLKILRLVPPTLRLSVQQLSNWITLRCMVVQTSFGIIDQNMRSYWREFRLPTSQTIVDLNLIINLFILLCLSFMFVLNFAYIVCYT
ncbi:hypothetical protein L9F63_022230, partial [Diploptera punctata]